jgi:hypothetical protein
MMNVVWCIGMVVLNQTERPAIRIYQLFPRMYFTCSTDSVCGLLCNWNFTVY